MTATDAQDSKEPDVAWGSRNGVTGHTGRVVGNNIMVETVNLSAGYGKCEILHGVDFRAGRGQITTLIGTNGSGKSTLLRVILGFLPFRDGDVKIDGISLKTMSREALARKIAYLPQGKSVPDISAERMVLHGRFPYLRYPRKYGAEDYRIAGAAMEQMGITEYADRQMSELSGGMRQKVYIAMALAQQAEVIVMDEPTTYLDIGQQLKFAEMMRRLSENGKTIILVLHDILLALKLSDRIAALQDGRILRCGTPEEILQSGVLERLYDVSVKSLQTETGVQYYYEIPDLAGSEGTIKEPGM